MMLTISKWEMFGEQEKKMKLWVENLLNSTLRAWRWVKHYVALHHVLPSKCITLTTAVDTISKLQNSKKKRERNTFIGWIFPNLHSLKKGKIYLFFETHTHTLYKVLKSSLSNDESFKWFTVNFMNMIFGSSNSCYHTLMS